MRAVKCVVPGLLIGMCLLAGCSKEEFGKPESSRPEEEGLVMLYEKVSGKEKAAALSGEEIIRAYDFSPFGVKGELTLVVDEYGELLKAGLSRQVYELLSAKTTEASLAGLPHAVLKQAEQLLSEGYDFWSNRGFIPPMSKDEFNSRMRDCEKKPTSIGVVLCALRTITMAISDCINASYFDESLHCW